MADAAIGIFFIATIVFAASLFVGYFWTYFYVTPKLLIKKKIKKSRYDASLETIHAEYWLEKLSKEFDCEIAQRYLKLINLSKKLILVSVCVIVISAVMLFQSS